MDRLTQILKDADTLKGIIERQAAARSEIIKANNEELEATFPGLLGNLKDCSKRKDLKGIAKLMSELKQKENKAKNKK